ncbi:MAG: fatty acid desaturase [Chloroflexi bacterium]|nr:fatty acid desaturase [Chloroflexota bacterium]
MTYQPLSEVRKTLRVDWYRCPMKPGRLRELSRRSDAQAWLQAGGHFALFLLTGAFVFGFWWNELWLGFLVALFCHGTVASFFTGIAPHELGHGTVFKTKWLNKVFLYLFSLIGWWDPFDYASSHTYHHRYTLHVEGDRENLLPLEPSLASTFMLQIFAINLLTQRGRVFSKGGLISTIIITALGAFGRVPADERAPINEWLKALHKDQPDQHQRSIWWSRILLAFHGGVLIAAIVSGWWVLPLLLTVPAFIANWLSYFVGLTQHCGLRDYSRDFRKNTRSIKINPLISFLYWRMNWHIEHHMYAGVPCYNLGKLYEEIKDDMPAPRSLVGAWREMRMIWDRQKSEPDYQYDTPLPASANPEPPPDEALPKRAASELERSIGELAPAGLHEG